MCGIKNQLLKWSMFTIILAILCFGRKYEIHAEDKTITVDSVEKLRQELIKQKYGTYNHLTITMKPGIYNVDSIIPLYSNTTVNAVGVEFRLNRDSTWRTIIGTRNQVDSDEKGGYGYANNIKINGGIYDGQGENGELIRFIHSQNIEIRNVKVRNVSDDPHLITLAGVRNVTIDNSELSGFVGKGEPKEAIHIDVVHNANMVPGTKIYDDTACENIVIKNNIVRDFPRAVGSHSFVKGVYANNIQIRNNKFYNLSAEAIKLYGFKNVDVLDNKIENSDIGVFAYTYWDENALKPLSTTKIESSPSDYNIMIRRNTFKNIKRYGVQVSGNSQDQLRGVDVVGNTFNNIQNTAIQYYKYAQSSDISNNIIKSSKNKGIGLYSYSSGNSIKNNRIYLTNSSAVYFENCARTRVFDNDIVNSSDHGICFYKNSIDAVIKGNTIKDVKKISICGNASKKAVIQSNKIYNCKEAGISMHNKSDDAVIQDNKVINAGGQGIGIYSSSKGIYIWKNIVDSAQKNGIYVADSASIRTRTNTIKNVKEHGLVYYRSSNGKVEWNTITTAKKNGIYLSKSNKNLIKSNTIKKANASGIMGSYCVKPIIQSNTIESSHKDGILLYSKNEKATIQSNMIKKVNGHGISLTKKTDKTYVWKNNIESPGKNGLYVSDSESVRSRSNSIRNAKGHGIVYYKNCFKAKVEWNTIISPKKSGIYVLKCKNSYFKNNTVKYAAKTPILLIECSKSKGSSIYYPKISRITSKSKKIYGKVKKKYKIYFYVKGKKIKTKISKEGKITSLKFKKQKSGSKIYMTIKYKDNYVAKNLVVQ